MISPLAIAIALGYGLTMVAVLGRRWLRRPGLWAAFAAGGLVFPLALRLITPVQLLLASIFGWDMDAYSTSLQAGLVGAVVTASVNEVFKLASALLVLSRGKDGDDTLAFGAASGAGFAVVGASEVIRLALITRALPIGSPSGFVASLTQQFAFVAVHTALTALTAFGATRRHASVYILMAILFESLFNALGLLFTLHVIANLSWTLLDASWGVLLLAYAFRLSLPARPVAHPSGAS